MSDSITTTFGPDQNGVRMVAFRTDKHRVTVKPNDAEHNADAEQFALDMYASSFVISALRKTLKETEEKLRETEEKLKALVAETNMNIEPGLRGKAIVRVDSKGCPWLLNNAEHGWASFGFRCTGWDELFRRFRCRVTMHRVDRHGPLWEVEPQ